MRRKGFNDPALLRFISGLIAHWEFYAPMRAVAAKQFSDEPSSWDAIQFIEGMWGALRDFDLGELDELSENDAHLAVWVKVFELRCILRRYVVLHEVYFGSLISLNYFYLQP